MGPHLIAAYAGVLEGEDYPHALNWFRAAFTYTSDVGQYVEAEQRKPSAPPRNLQGARSILNSCCSDCWFAGAPAVADKTTVGPLRRGVATGRPSGSRVGGVWRYLAVHRRRPPDYRPAEHYQ